VKLVVEESESVALERHLEGPGALATSRLAIVEVPRATAIANPAAEVRDEAMRMLASYMLVDISDGLLRAAAGLASASIRTLDAIHLASALRIEADELVGYDRRLAAAAADHGLVVTSPGSPA
jgi:predicted nucleic acid-binding protein